MDKIQDKPKRTNQLLKGTLILTIAGMVVKVIGSLNWIILSRVLGGEGIGLYQMAFPVYLLALSVSSAGIPVAISIVTAEKVALKDYFGAHRVFKLSLIILTITGLIFALLLFLGAGWMIEERIIRDSRAYYSLIALSPAVFFVTILSSFRGYLQGWQLMTPTAVSQIIEQLFRVGTMLIFAVMLLPKGIEYAAGGASMGAGAGSVAGLLVLIYSYWKLQQKVKSEQTENNITHEPDNKILKRIIKLAIPVSLSSLMLPAVANLDLFIVPLRLEHAGYTVEQSTELFGYLTGMGVPLVNLATIFTAALATSLVPSISNDYALKNYTVVAGRITHAFRVSSLVTLPACIILYLLSEPICNLIYHAPGAGPTVEVLSVAVFLLGIHQITTGVLQGLGRTIIPVINMVIAAIVKVILNWILTANPALGIQGAAWATVADIGIAAILNMYYVKQHTDSMLNIKSFSKNILAALIMGVTLYGVYHYLEYTFNDILVMSITVAIGALSYIIVLLMLGEVQLEEFEHIPVIGSVITKFLKK